MSRNSIQTCSFDFTAVMNELTCMEDCARNGICKGRHRSDLCTLTIVNLLCSCFVRAFSSPAPLTKRSILPTETLSKSPSFIRCLIMRTLSLGHVKPKIMLLYATSDRGFGKRKKEKWTRQVTFLIFPYHQTSFLSDHICITMGIQNEQTYY